jgi:hypothetical protein
MVTMVTKAAMVTMEVCEFLYPVISAEKRAYVFKVLFILERFERQLEGVGKV